jgi:integrase
VHIPAGSGIKGEGRVNRRKPQPTLDEGRRLYRLALRRAEARDMGALAVLCCLLLGLRRGEVVALKRRALDDGGRLLRVEDSKIQAGIQVLEVPEELKPLLIAQAVPQLSFVLSPRGALQERGQRV